VPQFRERLSRAQQRQYDRSNAVSAIAVDVSPRCARAVSLLEPALAHGDRPRTERVAQIICDELCAALRLPRVQVEVRQVRPSDRRGELHGLYLPANGSGRDRITLWMRTAKRGQVVAYRTFLRTLLHELCHHLDYTYLHLRDSLHTQGFYQRESSLFAALGAAGLDRRASGRPA